MSLANFFRGRRFLYIFLAIIYHVFLFTTWTLIQNKSYSPDTSPQPIPPEPILQPEEPDIQEPIEEITPDPPKKEEIVQYDRIQAQEIDRFIHESNQLKAQKKWAESVKFLDDGLAKFPYSDKLHTYKGGWYFDQANYTEAYKWYKKAGELNTQEVMYPLNAALCLVKLHRVKEANEFYKEAYRRKPTTGSLVTLWDNLCKMNDWEDYASHESQLVSGVRKELQTKGAVSLQPYHALHLPFNLKELYDIGSLHSRHIKENALKSFHRNFEFPKRDPNRKIRVGYVSYDFRNHAVGIQIQSMFGFHDSSKFEIYAYNVNDGTHDPYKDQIYEKIKKSVDHMVDFGTSLDSIATKIYNDQIDVLVDLGLFTAYSRMDVFSVRPAPIQVAYLGLATTTGADYYDYMIVDRYVVPQESEKYYSGIVVYWTLYVMYNKESLVFTPHSYHVLDHKQMYTTQGAADRRSNKLPEKKFLYCNHANNVRIDPQIFDVWAQIIKRANNSALVLKYYSEDAAENLRKEAVKRGLNVSPDWNNSDLLFLPGASSQEHIQRKAMCDVYLDIHKYNGHSTSADMMWAGVPMVTYPGESMASRAAGSFALSMGFPEMIAESWEQYIEKAVELANDIKKYKTLRKRVENARETSPLFDTRKWVKDWESALITMVSNYDQGKIGENVIVNKED